jgi:hypothetical protein
VLDLQARVAEELWREAVDLAACATLAGTVVERAAASVPVPAPAFLAQLGDHDTTPRSPAGQLLAYVTELRYLRSDLHAHALAAHELVGPTARTVDRLWKGYRVADEDIERLKRKGLVGEGRKGWVLTDTARQARDDAEAETDQLGAAALAVLSDEELAALQHELSRLPGDDPRPPEAR